MSNQGRIISLESKIAGFYDLDTLKPLDPLFDPFPELVDELTLLKEAEDAAEDNDDVEIFTR